MEIAPNGITIALDDDGKNTGDAYVEFATPEIASQAMNKHKEKIGHRLGGAGCEARVNFIFVIYWWVRLQ